MTCSRDELFAEVAYLAYHFHWGFDELLDLEHGIRRRFITEVGALNVAAQRG